MRAGRDAPLFMMAFDQRASFRADLLGIRGRPDAEQHRQICDLKGLIYEGFTQAVSEGVPVESAAILVDEEYGRDVALAARDAGVILAVSLERSGQAEFELEYGADFGRHVEEIDPDFAKVLVRYNPEGDAEVNTRQAMRLAELSSWLRERRQRFLFELLVPATKEQLQRIGPTTSQAYDHLRRPEFIIRAITALQDAGVEPDIWKIHGLNDSSDCERVVAQARRGGREQVLCIVLGHNHDQAEVRHWLRIAAGVEGYDGFAVGRTIWFYALSDLLDGQISRDEARLRIASTYHALVVAYQAGLLMQAPK